MLSSLRETLQTLLTRPVLYFLAYFQESGVIVDERQAAQVITMLATNHNNAKGHGDDGDLSSALTNSLFSSGEGQVNETGQWKENRTTLLSEVDEQIVVVLHRPIHRPT